MKIKQIIKYNSDNSYFAGFLQNILQLSNTNGNISQSDGYIILNINDYEDKLISFSELTKKYLPSSIFLEDIETINDNSSSYKTKEFISDFYNISLCPQCLEQLINPESSQYLNDNLKCTHYNTKESINIPDNKIYSPHYSQEAVLLVVDSNKIDKLFFITDNEIKALLCVEKPIIKVAIKDDELKELTKKKYLHIQAPLSIKSHLIALNARESKVPYLFFQNEEDGFFVTVVKTNIIIIKDNRGISKKLKILNQDKILNRFLNIAQEAGFKKDALGVYLSSKSKICFLLLNNLDSKIVIEFQTFALETTLRQMGEHKQRSKLLENFYKKYPDIINKLLEKDYTLFETLSIILELDDNSFEALSDKSLEFQGNGGLKIDMFFYDKGFDYQAFLGSVMSFKLAGTKSSYLAYSIMEAIADMTISTLSQLKRKFLITNFIMMGDMFSNSVLYNRILSKSATSTPYFSKQFALDD